MKDFKDLTPEELRKMDKDVIITITVALQGQLKSISSQLDYLTEQIALMNQRTFGRKTEKADYMQLSFEDVFNEAEFKFDDSKEPEFEEIIVSSHTRKPPCSAHRRNRERPRCSARPGRRRCRMV